MLCFFDRPLPYQHYLNLVILPFQEETVSAVNELINHNQPVSVSSSANLLERTYVHEYPVSSSGW